MLHAVVLMVGRDRVLVETRSQVLRTAGYIVVLAFNPRDAIDEFVKGDFDLVLLCHSIPSTPENGWRALSGSTHCSLRLFPSRPFDGQFDDFADATIENDPNLLIASLREVLHRGNDDSGPQQEFTG